MKSLLKISLFAILLQICMSVGASEPYKEGFTSIFNGKDLTGWKYWQSDKKGREGFYKVEDGAIVIDRGPTLFSDKEYEDYILRFQYKVDSEANSGMGLRAKLYCSNVAFSYFELQILDNTAKKYQRLKDWQSHGSVYGVVAAKRGFAKPVGEWNDQEIYFKGDHLKITLNGTVILDADLSQKTPVNKRYARGLARTRGHICFAGNGFGAYVKNIRIKELKSDRSILPKTADNTAPEGFRALFDGKSFANWKGQLNEPYDKPHERVKVDETKLTQEQVKADKKMNAHWSINNGELHFDGKGQSLVTEKKYGNFEMYCSWKIDKNGDSGIYLRGLPQLQIWDPSNPEEKRNGAAKGSGGLWNNKKEGKFPFLVADNPIGEWNTFFIRMINESVTVYLNGKLVVNGAPLNNHWEKGKPIPEREQIELQGHGHPVSWKNIYIRELP